MTTEHVPHYYEGWLLGVVASSNRCAADLFEAIDRVIRRCSVSLAVALGKTLRWIQHLPPTRSARMWDIDAGLHGPALKRSEMGEIFPPLLFEDR
uniref:Uncharacterized protein n=1 Tax=Physcomitrium patens TaxID=3218 RepID=A0A2K1KU08_PHYPA|nr:hypothetical protein PHYPA_004268 [Physcomitrium patens]